MNGYKKEMNLLNNIHFKDYFSYFGHDKYSLMYRQLAYLYSQFTRPIFLVKGTKKDIEKLLAEHQCIPLENLVESNIEWTSTEAKELYTELQAQLVKEKIKDLQNDRFQSWPNLSR
jgi:hypothetical protein